MNDTYAVVNKPKQPQPPSTGPAHPPVATPRSKDGSRATPPSHLYDNDPSGAAAGPIYTAVKPRSRPISSCPSAIPIYDKPEPTNPRPGEGPSLLSLVGDEHQSSADDDYEYVSSPVKDVTNYCPAGGLGFNSRIQKPRGPRDPPADWSRLER